MTTARHIIFVNEFYYPDICASAAVLSDRLPRLRERLPTHRLTVIAGNRAWDDPERLYPPEEMHEGIRIVRVSRPPVGSRSLVRRAAGFLAFGSGATKAAKRLDRADLVIGTTAPPHGSGIARRISRAMRCPYVYTVLDLYPDLAHSLGRLEEKSMAYRVWHWRDTAWMRGAARVVCISEGITNRIIATRGLSSEQVVTIRDGFDPARIGLAGAQAVNGRNSFREQYNPEGRVVVQYAGNMGLSHPFDTIMPACRNLASDHRLQFQFIGGGPQREYVRENLPSNGVLIDYQPAERLGELLSCADICLISQHEQMHDKALPYKVYGIFAARRPCIFVGNRESEIAAWLKSRRAGVAVAHGDVKGLEQAILQLAQDPDIRQRMGQAAGELLDERLHAEHAADRWVELIETVCAESR